MTGHCSQKESISLEVAIQGSLCCLDVVMSKVAFNLVVPPGLACRVEPSASYPRRHHPQTIKILE